LIVIDCDSARAEAFSARARTTKRMARSTRPIVRPRPILPAKPSTAGRPDRYGFFLSAKLPTILWVEPLVTDSEPPASGGANGAVVAGGP